MHLSADPGGVDSELSSIGRAVGMKELAKNTLTRTILSQASPNHEEIGTGGSQVRRELIAVGFGVNPADRPTNSCAGEYSGINVPTVGGNNDILLTPTDDEPATRSGGDSWLGAY